jgi:hypothetical protein
MLEKWLSSKKVVHHGIPRKAARIFKKKYSSSRKPQAILI